MAELIKIEIKTERERKRLEALIVQQEIQKILNISIETWGKEGDIFNEMQREYYPTTLDYSSILTEEEQSSEEDLSSLLDALKNEKKEVGSMSNPEAKEKKEVEPVSNPEAKKKEKKKVELASISIEMWGKEGDIFNEMQQEYYPTTLDYSSILTEEEQSSEEDLSSLLDALKNEKKEVGSISNPKAKEKKKVELASHLDAKKEVEPVSNHKAKEKKEVGSISNPEAKEKKKVELASHLDAKKEVKPASNLDAKKEVEAKNEKEKKKEGGLSTKQVVVLCLCLVGLFVFVLKKAIINLKK